MSTGMLNRRFSEMSNDRDKIEESHTEARGYQTSEGFVQEVVSTSPARASGLNGELVQVVTRRKTITTLGPEGEGVNEAGVGTAPRLVYAGSEGDLMTRTSSLRSANMQTWEKANTEYSRTSSALNNQEAVNNTVLGDTDTFPSFYKGTRANVNNTPPAGYSPAPSIPAAIYPITGQLQYANLNPPSSVLRQSVQYAADRINNGFGPSESPSRRTVRIGGDVDTRVIEPSRVSPIRPQPGYAPVRFVTRAQLKQMREQQLWGAPSAPRSTTMASYSTNRYDVQRDDPSHQFTARAASPGSRTFAPAGGIGQAWPEVGTRWGPQGQDDDLESMASSAQGQYRRDQARNSQWGINSTPSRRSASGNRSASAYGDEGVDGYYVREARYQRSGSAPQYNRLGVMADASRGGRHYSPVPQYRVELRDLLAVDLDVADVAGYLAAMRQTSSQSVPPQATAAFKLLTRGTYLVKYGRQGSPHERFFALRMIPDEVTGRTHPYLVWATHADSAAFNTRLHLSYLVQALAGTQTTNFTRLMTGPKHIEGPHVGDRKSTLPTTYAMTFIFQSAHTRRSVDVLALDDQTFRCWMIVLTYFASINSGAGAHEVPEEVDTLAPDTPRSQSQASQWA